MTISFATPQPQSNGLGNFLADLAFAPLETKKYLNQRGSPALKRLIEPAAPPAALTQNPIQSPEVYRLPVRFAQESPMQSPSSTLRTISGPLVVGAGLAATMLLPEFENWLRAPTATPLQNGGQENPAQLTQQALEELAALQRRYIVNYGEAPGWLSSTLMAMGVLLAQLDATSPRAVSEGHGLRSVTRNMATDSTTAVALPEEAALPTTDATDPVSQHEGPDNAGFAVVIDGPTLLRGLYSKEKRSRAPFGPDARPGWDMGAIAHFAANLPKGQQEALLSLAPPDVDAWVDFGHPRRTRSMVALSRKTWNIAQRLEERRENMMPEGEKRELVITEELWERVDIVYRATEAKPKLRSQYVATDGVRVTAGDSRIAALQALRQKRIAVELPVEGADGPVAYVCPPIPK